MIIPIRCLTCGKVIADKYNTYLQKVEENKIKNNLNLDESILYVNSKEIKKTIEGEILLGLKSIVVKNVLFYDIQQYLKIKYYNFAFYKDNLFVY